MTTSPCASRMTIVSWVDVVLAELVEETVLREDQLEEFAKAFAVQGSVVGSIDIDGPVYCSAQHFFEVEAPPHYHFRATALVRRWWLDPAET